MEDQTPAGEEHTPNSFQESDVVPTPYDARAAIHVTDIPAKETWPAPTLTPWGVVLLAYLAFFGVDFLGQIVVATIIPNLAGWSQAHRALWLSSVWPEVLLVTVSTFGILWSFYLWLGRNNPAMRRQSGVVAPPWYSYGWGPAAVVPYFMCAVLALAILSVASPAFKDSLILKQQLGISGLTGPVQFGAVFFTVCILTPILEETTFRGIIFGSLSSRYKFFPAALLTSVLFALPHMAENNTGILWALGVQTCILSLILCGVRAKTRSIFPGMITHGLINGAAVVLLALGFH